MKYNLPDNLISEKNKYNELFDKGSSRTTGGSISYTSTTSGTTYTTSEGDAGLLQILDNVLKDYRTDADDINGIVNEIGILSQNLESTSTDLTALQNSLNTHFSNYTIQIPYAVATGTANTYAVELSPAPTSYVDGMAICIKINVQSTGASTINVNTLGAKSILDSLGNAITAGGLKANTPYTLRYNGTNFIVQGKGGGGTATASDIVSGKTATVDSGVVTGTLIPRKVAKGTFTASVQYGYTVTGLTFSPKYIAVLNTSNFSGFEYFNGTKMYGYGCVSPNIYPTADGFYIYDGNTNIGSPTWNWFAVDDIS